MSDMQLVSTGLTPYGHINLQQIIIDSQTWRRRTRGKFADLLGKESNPDGNPTQSSNTLNRPVSAAQQGWP